MLPLMYKDFYLTRKHLLSLTLLGLAVAALLGRTGAGTTVFLAVAWVALWNFTARVGYVEERNRTYGLLWTLPLPRRVIVRSKFASVVVVWAGQLCLYALAAKVYELVGLTQFDTLPPATAFFGSLPMLVLMGLYLYLILRFDYLRATNGLRFVFLLFLVPLAIPAGYLEPAARWLEAAAAHPSAPAAGSALAAAVYLGFMRVAEQSFERKELRDVG